MAARRATAAPGAAPLFLLFCGFALVACRLCSGYTLPGEAGLSDEEIEQYNSTPASYVENADREHRYPKYTSTIAVASDSRDRLLRQIQKELQAAGNGGDQNLSSMLQHSELGSKLSKREEALLKAATPGNREPNAGTRKADEELDDIAFYTDDHDPSALLDLDEPEDDLEDIGEEDGAEYGEESFVEDVETHKEGKSLPGRYEATVRNRGKPEGSTRTTKFEDDLTLLQEEADPYSLEEPEEDEDPEAFLEEDEFDDEDVDTDADAGTGILYNPYAAREARSLLELQKSSSENRAGDVEERGGENNGEPVGRVLEEESTPLDAPYDTVASFIEMAPVQQSIHAHFRTAPLLQAGSRSAAAAARDNISPHYNLNFQRGREAAYRPASFSQERNHELADQGPVEDELLREVEEGEGASEPKDISVEGGAEAADMVGEEAGPPAAEAVGQEAEPPLVEPPPVVQGQETITAALPESSELAPPPEEEAAGLGVAPAETGALAEEMGPAGNMPPTYEVPATASAGGYEAGPEGSPELGAGAVAGVHVLPQRARTITSEEDSVLGPVGVGEDEAVAAAGTGDYFPNESLNLQGKKLREPAEDILRKTRAGTELCKTLSVNEGQSRCLLCTGYTRRSTPHLNRV